MQKSIFFIIAVFGLLLFLPEASLSQSIDEIIKKADELQNIVSADAEHEALVKMLKDAAAKNPNNFDLQWRTARALGIWADQINMRNTLDNAKKANPKNVDGILAAEKDMSPELGKKVSALGGEARGYAEKAISLNPNRVEGYYYNSLALSMYSLGKGIISALAEGIRPKLVETVKKAIEKDKAYNEASPLRVYGRYYYKVPWPYNDKTGSEKILHEAGFKATPARMKLLGVFQKAKQPISIQEIKRLLKGVNIDQATLYRIVNALQEANVVEQIDLKHGHEDYELALKKHHHHVVCKV